MNRKLANAIAYICTSEVLPVLRQALSRPNSIQFKETFLVSVRDRLYQVVERFERDDLSEHFADVYLPLFDSLSLVTYALMMTPMGIDHLRQAEKTLSILHRVTWQDNHTIENGTGGAA